MAVNSNDLLRKAFSSKDIPYFKPVFVYETLLNQEIVEKFIGHKVKNEIDALDNFKEVSLSSVEGEDFHTIIPSPGDQVKGRILYLTDHDLKVMDDRENLYTRTKIKTKREKIVWVYILSIANMKDFGQNTEHPLTPEDMKMIQDLASGSAVGFFDPLTKYMIMQKGPQFFDPSLPTMEKDKKKMDKKLLAKHLEECGIKISNGWIAEADVDRAIKITAEWQNYPKGWTKESAEKFWKSLTGKRVHKRTACMKAMEGKLESPGAFCNSLYQMFEVD